MAKVKTCGLYIINSDNKLLICHPTNHAPDFWTIPKGKVEEGELYYSAAIRETTEETGLDLSAIRMLPFPLPVQVYRHKKKELHSWVVFEDDMRGLDFTLSEMELYCESMVEDENIISKQKIKRPFPENDDFKWVTLGEAKELLHYPQIPQLETISKLINE